MATRPVRSKTLVPLLLALAALGCGSEESATPPAAPEAPAPAPAAPAAPPATAPEAQAPPAAVPAPAVVEEVPEWTGELPNDYPEDVPHYPGAKVTLARGNAEIGIAVTFDSPDDREEVAKFYADGLAAFGWQVQLDDIPEGRMIVAQKEDRQASAIVYAGGQGTLVNLIVVPME